MTWYNQGTGTATLDPAVQQALEDKDIRSGAQKPGDPTKLVLNTDGTDIEIDVSWLQSENDKETYFELRPDNTPWPPVFTDEADGDAAVVMDQDKNMLFYKREAGGWVQKFDKPAVTAIDPSVVTFTDFEQLATFYNDPNTPAETYLIHPNKEYIFRCAGNGVWNSLGTIHQPASYIGARPYSAGDVFTVNNRIRRANKNITGAPNEPNLVDWDDLMPVMRLQDDAIIRGFGLYRHLASTNLSFNSSMDFINTNATVPLFIFYAASDSIYMASDTGTDISGTLPGWVTVPPKGVTRLVAVGAHKTFIPLNPDVTAGYDPDIPLYEAGRVVTAAEQAAGVTFRVVDFVSETADLYEAANLGRDVTWPALPFNPNAQDGADDLFIPFDEPVVVPDTIADDPTAALGTAIDKAMSVKQSTDADNLRVLKTEKAASDALVNLVFDDTGALKLVLTKPDGTTVDAPVPFVDDLISGGSKMLLSAQQGVVLRNLIEGIGERAKVADNAAMALDTSPDGQTYYVEDDGGSGQWALYQRIAGADEFILGQADLVAAYVALTDAQLQDYTNTDTGLVSPKSLHDALKPPLRATSQAAATGMTVLPGQTIQIGFGTNYLGTYKNITSAALNWANGSLSFISIHKWRSGLLRTDGAPPVPDDSSIYYKDWTIGDAGTPSRIRSHYWTGVIQETQADYEAMTPAQRKLVEVDWHYYQSADDGAGGFVWLKEFNPADVTDPQSLILNYIEIGLRSSGTNASSRAEFVFVDNDGNNYPAGDWAYSADLTQYAGGADTLVTDKALWLGGLTYGRNKEGTVKFYYTGINPNGLSDIIPTHTNSSAENGGVTVTYQGTNYNDAFANTGAVTGPLYWTTSQEVTASDQAAPLIAATEYLAGTIFSNPEPDNTDPDYQTWFNWRVNDGETIADTDIPTGTEAEFLAVKGKLTRFGVGSQPAIALGYLSPVDRVVSAPDPIPSTGGPFERVLYQGNTTSDIWVMDNAGANPVKVTNPSAADWANGVRVDDLATGDTYQYDRGTNRFELLQLLGDLPIVRYTADGAIQDTDHRAIFETGAVNMTLPASTIDRVIQMVSEGPTTVITANGAEQFTGSLGTSTDSKLTLNDTFKWATIIGRTAGGWSQYVGQVGIPDGVDIATPTMLKAGTRLVQNGIDDASGATFPEAFKVGTTPTMKILAQDTGDNVNVTLQTVTNTGFTTWVVRNESDVGIGSPTIHWEATGEAA